jgi:Protein of unknown function (DUF2799)
MKHLPTCLLICLAAALAGCETLSPAECATADWRQLGQQDGGRGEPDRSADYFESCSKAKIAVDTNAYRTGRAEGLQSFCRPANAINEGLGGRAYRGVCPIALDASFRSIHDISLKVHEARQNINRIQRDQANMQSELSNPKTSDERRFVLRDLLSRSDRQLRDARNYLGSSEFQFNQMQGDLRARGLL